VDYFNTNSGIILPNEWNLTNFKTNGVNIPIKKCPLFVDTNKFYYKTPNDSPIFVFGSGNADPRKKTNNVIRSFCRTFPPDIKNVKLKIKIERCDLPFLNSFSDKRIEVLTKHLSKTELSDWYHNLDVFISGATSEGWGFMQHEAMSCGRPVISVDYGGVKEFFNSSVGIIVKHTEVVAENQWGTAGGFWSKYDEIDMINKIKWCYENRKTIHDIGILSSIKAQKFDIPNFIYNLITILNEFDMYC
jgi:glycosyltransferase involved in cell wall biosynthesis